MTQSHLPPLKPGPRILLPLLILLFFIPHHLGAETQIYFVCNKHVPLITISKRDVKNIFLGKKTTWSDQQKVTFAVLKEKEAYDTFLNVYLRKSSQQFDCYWLNMVFTGEGFFPKTFDSDEKVIEFVAKTEGAIGYVSHRLKSRTVRQLTILD